MKAYVITPYHRLGDLYNLIDNFKRQKYNDKFLIVIENAEAIDSFPDLMPFPHKVLQVHGECTAGKARNVALEYIQSLGKNDLFWTNFDADDLYQMHYLNIVALAFKRHPDKMVGLRRHLTQTSTKGLFWFLGPSSYIHGATMSCCDVNIRYPDKVKVAEDHTMVNNWIESGHQLHHLDTDQYVWIRNNNGQGHTFSDSDWAIWSHSLENHQHQTIVDLQEEA